jgi:hypothetical protein
VSPRRAYPRRNESHEGAAADVLDRHRQMAGWAPSLPIPVELIIDATFDVRISWDDIAERPGEWILGALHPKSRSIVLNDRHEDLLIDVVGPLNFTLAHELGHWLYDADDPNQEQLFDPDQPVFCRRLQGDDPGPPRPSRGLRSAPIGLRFQFAGSVVGGLAPGSPYPVRDT